MRGGMRLSRFTSSTRVRAKAAAIGSLVGDNREGNFFLALFSVGSENTQLEERNEMEVFG